MLRHSYLKTGILSIALSAAGTIAESKALPASSSPTVSQVEAVVRDIHPIVRADHQSRIMTLHPANCKSGQRRVGRGCSPRLLSILHGSQTRLN
jgi:hypothetical protein